MSYLKFITPTNLATEKERFFTIANYSPQLQYNWSEESISSFTKSNPCNGELIDALLSQDTTKIIHAAANYFNVEFRPEDITLAKKLASSIPPSINATATDYATLMQDKLTQLGIDYQVKLVDKHGFQARPVHNKQLLKISKHLHLQFLTPDEITNHELVHIIRAVNGQHNHIPTSSNYLPTEEGLACLIQDKFLATPTPAAFQHALEYLSAYLSQTAGFREIYDFLINHGFDAENAWLRGIRQKFGLRDTSQPGGLLKSGMYFYHENLLKTLTRDELLRLFVGKISLSNLSKYPSYTGIISKDILLKTLF